MSTKKDLINLCKVLGINNKNLQGKTKDHLRNLIKSFELANDTKILAQGKVIDTIYHTADIHIRVLERHSEYRTVFQNLYNKLNEQGNINGKGNVNSVLVICGDLFHKRDHLVSETIILFNEFIEKMCSIIDVIIILGNHDIFTHTNRLDTVTGIITLKDLPNFYFLKNSGVYKYHNLSFHVSSLLDNKFLRCPLTREPEITYISLYHGPVANCKLDNGMSFLGDQETVKISDFNKFDLVLLGDIHKRQFLGESKIMAYPGSLIQQNHAEELKHGILEWKSRVKSKMQVSDENGNGSTGSANMLKDSGCNSANMLKDSGGNSNGVPHWEATFLEIENEYRYLTVILINGQLTIGGQDLSSFKFTKYSYIKLFHNYLEDLDLDNLKKQISQFTEIKGFAKEILVTQKNKIESALDPETIFIDHQTYSLNLFKKCCSEYPEDFQEKLMALHQKTLKGYSANDASVNAQKENGGANSWAISEISFKNVFIYGGDVLNTISFKDTPGIIGILGNNAMGKSSIFNIIIYCLFGNVFKSKSYKNRNIINDNANDFFIQMKIKMKNNGSGSTSSGKDVCFIIERKGKNKKRKDNMSMEDHVNFYQVNGDGSRDGTGEGESIGESETQEVICLTDSNKNNTMDKIHSTLNLTTKEAFILTNVMSYTHYISLLSMTNTEMSSKLSELFNLQMYSEMYSDILKRHRHLTTELSIKEGLLSNTKCCTTEELNDITVQIEELKINLNSILNEMDIISNELDLNIQNEIELGALKDSDTIYSKETYVKLTDQYNSIIDDLDREEYTQFPGASFHPEIEASGSNSNLFELRHSVKELKSQIKNLSDLNVNHFIINDENLKDLQTELNVLINSKVPISKAISEAKYAKVLKKNYIQSTDLTEDLLSYNDLNRYQDTIAIPKDLYDELIHYLKQMNSSEYIQDLVLLNSWESYQADLKTNKEIQSKIDVIQGKIKYHLITKLDSTIVKLNKLKLIKDSEELSATLDLMEAYFKNEDNIKKKLIYQKIGVDLKNKKELLTKDHLTINKKLIKLELGYTTQLELTSQCTILKESITVLKAQEKLYKVYKGIINDRSLPKMILVDTMKKIELEANILIYKLIGLYILLVNEESSGWEILVKKNGAILGIEHTSGFEKFIINVCLKITLDTYKFSDKIQFFAIDEAFDCVSGENVYKIEELFSILRAHYTNVLIISHNEELKKMIDHRIYIDSDFICSKIKQV